MSSTRLIINFCHLVAGFLFFFLGLIFMFFNSVVVIWGFFFSSGVFCVCLPRKFMGLKAKVCFTRDMVRIWV